MGSATLDGMEPIENPVLASLGAPRALIVRLADGATVASVVGSGLMAGLLFAFSTSVMTSLRRLPTGAGITAMQGINVAILNPVFGLLFAGTTLSCVVLAATAPFSGRPAAAWLAAGAVLFLVGVVGVTVAVNVPLNDSLAALDPASADSAAPWQHYLTRWTAWNHVRTMAGVGATILLEAAALRR